jgi:hypothetical protein
MGHPLPVIRGGSTETSINRPMGGTREDSNMAVSTAQQQMIVDAFNSQVYIQDRMDVQHTPIYDTVNWLPGATMTENNSTWFTNVGPAAIYYGAVLKTFAQTNMTQSQKLPAPEAFSIYGIRLRIKEDVLRSDLDNILDGTPSVAGGNGFAFEFWLGQKCYQRAPLWYFAAGGGIWGAASQAVLPVPPAVGIPATVLTNGIPDRNGMHKLILNIVIENQMTFYARLVGGAYLLQAAAVLFGTGCTMQCLLDGLYARGVQ